MTSSSEIGIWDSIYFEDLKKEIAAISEAATGNEIISKLWEENKRLKRMLVLVGRARF